MEKLKFAFAALVLVTTISFAQPANTPVGKLQGRHQHTNKMQELNLTEDQKAQMKMADEEYKAQLKALNSNENQTVKQQRDQSAALEQARKAKLETLLTAEQKSKMAELKATSKQNRPEKSAKHVQDMQKELNLTDVQVDELKNNHAALKNKMDAIKNNTSLDEASKRSQMAALKEDQKAMFDKVLTAEQKQKFQGMHKEHKGNMKKHNGKKRKAENV